MVLELEIKVTIEQDYEYFISNVGFVQNQIVSFKKDNLGLFKQISLKVFPHLVPFVLPLDQMALTTSVYTILALALERFIAVHWLVSSSSLSKGY